MASSLLVSAKSILLKKKNLIETVFFVVEGQQLKLLKALKYSTDVHPLEGFCVQYREEQWG